MTFQPLLGALHGYWGSARGQAPASAARDGELCDTDEAYMGPDSGASDPSAENTLSELAGVGVFMTDIGHFAEGCLIEKYLLIC